MEYLLKCPEKLTPPRMGLCRVRTERGKVTSATPSFAWAVGGGLHAVLSYCASQSIKWERHRPSPAQAHQMELPL